MIFELSILSNSTVIVSRVLGMYVRIGAPFAAVGEFGMNGRPYEDMVTTFVIVVRDETRQPWARLQWENLLFVI